MHRTFWYLQVLTLFKKKKKKGSFLITKVNSHDLHWFGTVLKLGLPLLGFETGCREGRQELLVTKWAKQIKAGEKADGKRLHYPSFTWVRGGQTALRWQTAQELLNYREFNHLFVQKCAFFFLQTETMQSAVQIVWFTFQIRLGCQYKWIMNAACCVASLRTQQASQRDVWHSGEEREESSALQCVEVTCLRGTECFLPVPRTEGPRWCG